MPKTISPPTGKSTASRRGCLLAKASLAALVLALASIGALPSFALGANVSITDATTCGWDGPTLNKNHYVLRPTVSVKRNALDTGDSRVTVLTKLYEGSSTTGFVIGQLSAGHLGANGEVTPGAYPVANGATEKFRPFNGNDLPSPSPFDVAFGDSFLHHLDPTHTKYGGPPLNRDRQYTLQVRVFDLDASEEVFRSFPCRARPPTTGCPKTLHAVFAVYGYIPPPPTAADEKPNGCWTWARPRLSNLWKEYWTDCDTFKNPNQLKGAAGTGAWVYNETRTDQIGDDASFIPACANRSIQGSNQPLAVTSTLAYIYMAPPKGAGTIWLPASTKSVIQDNSRVARYFAELYTSTTFGHPLYTKWRTNGKVGSPMTNIGRVGTTPTNHNKIYAEITDLCADLSANGITGKDIGIYAGSTQDIDDRTADHRLSAVVEALNDCTKP
jgi:hypothetical protein